MMDLEDLIALVLELEDRVTSLERRLSPPEDCCSVCGVELPELGQAGHNVRLEGGIESHYCDGH